MDKNKNQKLLNKSTSFKSTIDLKKKIEYKDNISKQYGYLIILGSNGEEKKIIELGDEDYLIGRIPECNIQFQEDNISRKHALISFRENEYWLEDLGSKNGTYINGVKVAKCSLRNNDQIDIGGVKMYFNEITVL
jgi:pSer/pThr/pTyr-binding forkhead associated (FHA) protein